MTAVQQWFRSIAEERAAGLVEVRVVAGTIRVIRKRLEKAAYIFTGSLFMPRQEACLVWTVVSGSMAQSVCVKLSLPPNYSMPAS
jgi:hypothetical protein